MKKKICMILSVLLLVASMPLTVFAGELPTPKLDTPEFQVPDNMPDAFASLQDKYNTAIERLQDKGLGVNNYKDGIGELKAPPGFGKGPDGLSSAEDIFNERYGDMWNNQSINSDFTNQHLESKDDRIKDWKENYEELGETPSFNPLPELEDLPEYTLPELKPLNKDIQLTKKTLTSYAKMSDSEFNNYLGNLEKEYRSFFNQKQPGEVAFEEMANVPSFEITNKWADLMESPEEAASKYKFMTDEERADMINNREKLEGFDEINSKTLEDIKWENSLLDKLTNAGKNLINGIKGGIGKLFGNDSKASKQAKSDEKQYKDTYKKYYNKGGVLFGNKEQSKQRHQILDVFKEHGIYDRDKDRSKASNKKEMGKLIEDNMDLLKKEIPGFKAYD